ncbi:MAG TPA: ABC transporter permease [Microbacteriaceae bacterium]|nr:ABC transporter permease [Microbacteriaceae bacterium]HQZ48388.1 ABC transporter permease [Microbacteriaceae bacterium]
MARMGIAPFVGAIGEAWDELRVHKLRVLLSLIGVAVAVASLTAVVAIGDLQRQYMSEQNDRWGGREATIAVSMHGTGAEPVDGDAWNEHVERVFERYDFSHSSRSAQTELLVGLPDGMTMVQARVVDPAFGAIHRVNVDQGRWFVPVDASLLAPPVVISAPLWERLGSPSIDGHPTLRIGGAWDGVYQVIGVTPKQGVWDEELRVDMLFENYRAPLDAMPDIGMQYEVWLTAAQAAEIGPVLAQDLRAGLAEGFEVNVQRTDFGAQMGGDPMAVFTLITGAIAGIVLLLGGLSLVNIQLVAMRQRIREIGVRRSFGATGGRIFLAVMLENVVATLVAGVIGIVLVVVAMQQPFIVQGLAPGISDVPPFPFSAALTGLIAAVGVGAIAGLIPALVAVRVKPIDAIRF